MNEAWKYIQDIEKLFIQNKDMATYIMGLYYLKETYYSVAGQYSEALKMVDAMMNDSTPIRSKYMDYKLVREQGNIYWKMGDKLKAAEFTMIILRLPTLSVQKSCRILPPSFLLFWSWSS